MRRTKTTKKSSARTDKKIKTDKPKKKIIKKPKKVALKVKISTTTNLAENPAETKQTSKHEKQIKIFDKKQKKRKTVLKAIRNKLKKESTKPKKIELLEKTSEISQDAYEKQPKKNLKKDKTLKKDRTKNEKTVYDKTINEKIERDKRLIMWTGVTFFMVLIIFFWIYNIKQMFKNSAIKNNSEYSLTDWREMTDEVSDKINQMKKDMESIKSFDNISTTSPAKLPENESAKPEENLFFSTTTESQISHEKINELKEKVEKLEKKLEDKHKDTN